MLADYIPEKHIEQKILEQYLNEQKEKGQLDEVTNNGNGTIIVEVDGYEITIKEDDLSIIETQKTGGVRPIVEILVTKIDGSKIEPNEKDTLEQKAMTINITNIEEFGENYTIEVKDEVENILTKEPNIISGITGQASYIISKKGSYTIVVTGTKDEKTRKVKIIEQMQIARPTVEESKIFNKANGVIDIVWLNTDNTTREEPLSPKEYRGGLTAIKYSTSEGRWIQADENNNENNWYHYVEQTGQEDGKTSYWANAVANYEGNDDEKAYFVWIPRYAYKITYFAKKEQAQAYRENGSTDGIIGYSNIEGMIKVENGTEKLVYDSEPINVVGKVKNAVYKDYIVHPAFEFNGSEARYMGGKI